MDEPLAVMDPSQVPDDDKVLIVPTDRAALTTFLQREGRTVLVEFSKRCRLQKDGTVRPSEKGPLSPKETRDLIALLTGISNIDGATPEMFKKTSLQRILATVSNRVPDATWRFSFPPEAMEIAGKVYDHYESENWGEGAQNLLPDEADGVQPGPTSPVAPPTTTTDRTYARRAPPNHPIYGVNGIMRGILAIHGEKKMSYGLGKFQLISALDEITP